MPRVSVIIPVYNRAIFVGAAIESILAQTFADFELIVIDDGSTDATPDMVRSFADPRIRLVGHECNLGIPAARNSGLAAARGRYVATLDSDDVAHPKRLERQVAFLDAHPDHALVGSWTADMDENGRPLGKIRRKPTRPADVRAKLLFGGSVTNSTIMGRTEILRRYGYREEFRVRQDYDLFARLSERYPIANLPEALVWVRRHPGQETNCRAAQVFERSAAVIEHQLRSLGVRFDERDLARHYVLPRLGREKLERQGVPVRADAGFQDWAEAWLRGLARANQGTGLYDDRALRELIGSLWLRTAWYTFRLRGWAAWRAFLSSDLARLLVPALRDRLGRRVPQIWEPVVRRLAGAAGIARAAERGRLGRSPGPWPACSFCSSRVGCPLMLPRAPRSWKPIEKRRSSLSISESFTAPTIPNRHSIPPFRFRTGKPFWSAERSVLAAHWARIGQNAMSAACASSARRKAFTAMSPRRTAKSATGARRWISSRSAIVS